ncbi:MAG: PD40 domain-containing protein [Armatimonadetes bacterium]|nr:PD40 domain-containing protein [Anaerolineae bacterium]
MRYFALLMLLCLLTALPVRAAFELDPADLEGVIAFIALSPEDAPLTDVYSMRPDGSDLRNLTENPGNYHSLAWSPDSERLMYSVDRDGDGSDELYVLFADGTGESRLAAPSQPSVTFQIYDLVWSECGILFTARLERGAGMIRSDIYTIFDDGSKLEAIVVQDGLTYTPAPAPDCLGITYQYGDTFNGTQLLTANERGEPTLLFSDGSNPLFPRYFPDGAQIAYYANGAGIFVMPSDPDEAEDREQIVPLGFELLYSLAIAPDGATFAFALQDGVFLADVKDGEPMRVADISGAFSLGWGIPPEDENSDTTSLESLMQGLGGSRDSSDEGGDGDNEGDEQPTLGAVTCEIRAPLNVNLRASPGKGQDRGDILAAGETLLAVARYEGNNRWLLLENELWVRQDVVEPLDDCDELPEVDETGELIE